MSLIKLLQKLVLFCFCAGSLSAGAEPLKVTLGQSTTSFSFLPIWAARATGAFEAKGVNLTWTAIPGGDPNALAALDAGDLDVAAVGSETALLAIGKGRPFVLVAPIMNILSLQLVVSDRLIKKHDIDMQAPVTERLKALKGAVIGVSAVKGAQERMARWLIAEAGLDPINDIRIALIGSPPALRAALERGQIDGFLLSPPEGLIAKDQGFGTVYVDLAKEFGQFRDYPFLVLVAKRPISTEKAEKIRRVIAALNAGRDNLENNFQSTIESIRTRFYPKVKLNVLDQSARTMLVGVKDRSFSTTGITKVVKLANQTGNEIKFSKKAAPFTNAYDK